MSTPLQKIKDRQAQIQQQKFLENQNRILDEKEQERLQRLSAVDQKLELVDEKIVLIDDTIANTTEFITEASAVLTDTLEQAQAELARAQEIQKGADGEDYRLTDEDREEIASLIEVPIVEKVIEKTEVIREQPIVTEVTKVIKEVDNEAIIKEIVKKLKKDFSTEQTVISKLEKMILEKKVKTEDVEGLEQTLSAIRRMAGGFRGGGDTVLAGSNIVIAEVDGKKVISATVPTDTDTLQTVTDRGNTTTKDLVIIGSYAYTYNSDDTVATKTNTTTGYVMTFSYNSDGTVSSKTDGSKTWTYTYNSGGTLSTKIVT